MRSPWLSAAGRDPWSRDDPKNDESRLGTSSEPGWIRSSSWSTRGRKDGGRAEVLLEGTIEAIFMECSFGEE
jgi:hypothetical protein